ncbi:MAG: hypothetical protein ACKO4Q_08580 [Planctomycetota bacterium]
MIGLEQRRTDFPGSAGDAMLARTVESRPAPTCARCRHYWVTHQPSTPHGCRAYGILSARLPSVEIRMASGQDCSVFEERPSPPRPQGT